LGKDSESEGKKSEIEAEMSAKDEMSKETSNKQGTLLNCRFSALF
jgi:hypothetical protein